jgi:hypothetical protein
VRKLSHSGEAPRSHMTLDTGAAQKRHG